MMKNILIFSLIIIFSCKNATKGNLIKTQEKSRLIDSTTTAIINYDSNSIHHNYIFENSKKANLTDSDILKIESQLEKCISEHNVYELKLYNKIKKERPEAEIYKQNFVIELNRYKRQYLPVTNELGEKEVWINCFCTTHNRNWKESILSAKDGGNCFFKLKVNLTNDVFYDFWVNGSS